MADKPDKVVIPLEDLQRMLGHDRPYDPTPDDDTPTQPDLIPACPECKGVGAIAGKTCESCDGEGVALARREHE